MAVEPDELELLWPAQLFAEEAQALLAAGHDDTGTVGWLLAEAFHDDRGRELFDQVAAEERSRCVETDDPWGERRTYTLPRATTKLLTQLAREAPDLPRYCPPRYYSQRRKDQAEPRLTLPQLMAAFAREVHRLDATGYFADSFGSSCVDSPDGDPDEAGQRQLVEAVGSDGALWPLNRLGQPTGIEQAWTQELFYDVVEALHDRVARPRRRRWHDYGREWDYDDFARLPGRALYRWRVNQLFDRSLVPLRLAESGSDTGRLVHAAGDPRDELVEQALTTPATDDRAAVELAVALFRSRDAGREDKRSAVLALSRVLEDRRQLIREQLIKKDEGALFRIANEFDLRHRGTSGSGRQQWGDYDEAFLDWVFWWYLSTIALTDRLLARQAVSGG